MQNSLLNSLYKTLSDREKAAFVRFVQSPYVNRKPELARLAHFLIDGPDRSGGKAAAFAAAFGADMPYDDGRMRKSMEHLLRLMEEFLVAESRQEDPIDGQLFLTKALLARRQERLLQRLLASPPDFPEDESNWTVLHFEQAVRWYQLVYDHQSTTRRVHDPALYERIARYQTVALLARRLYLACIFRSNQKEKGPVSIDPLLAWAVQNPSTGGTAQPILLTTLLAGYQALHEPALAAHFDRFRQGLLEQGRCFSPNDRRELLLVAINFCSQRYNAGDKAYLDTQLELYDHGLREGLLLENNWVTGYTFTNIATLALIGRRYDWLEHFISEYRTKLEPPYRVSAAAFNQARLDYARGLYRPALALLQLNIFDDVLLNLSAKTVQAKCFYELQEYVLLEDHLEALRKFIHRHKEVGSYGQRYLNFISVLRRLVKNSRPNENQLAIQRELSDMEVVAEKEWLLQQLL